MEAATEMKVTAYHCKDCGTFSEARRPGCSGHEVQQVQVQPHRTIGTVTHRLGPCHVNRVPVLPLYWYRHTALAQQLPVTIRAMLWHKTAVSFGFGYFCR